MEPFLWECRNGEELRQREGRQKQGKKVGGTRKEQGEGKSSWKKKVEKQRKGRKRERGKGRNLLLHELGGTGHGGEVGTLGRGMEPGVVAGCPALESSLELAGHELEDWKGGGQRRRE